MRKKLLLLIITIFLRIIKARNIYRDNRINIENEWMCEITVNPKHVKTRFISVSLIIKISLNRKERFHFFFTFFFN